MQNTTYKPCFSNSAFVQFQQNFCTIGVLSVGVSCVLSWVCKFERIYKLQVFHYRGLGRQQRIKTQRATWQPRQQPRFHVPVLKVLLYHWFKEGYNLLSIKYYCINNILHVKGALPAFARLIICIFPIKLWKPYPPTTLMLWDNAFWQEI